MKHNYTLALGLMCLVFFGFTSYTSFNHKNEIAKLEKKVDSIQLETKEVQLTRMIVELQPAIEHNTLIEYKEAITEASKKWKISPILLAAVVFRESSFKQYSKGTKLPSGNRCIGPMQIHPVIHKDKLEERGLKKDHLYDIAVNVDIGTEILKSYLVKYDYNVKRALYHYVGGKSPNYVMDIINWYVQYDC